MSVSVVLASGKLLLDSLEIAASRSIFLEVEEALARPLAALLTPEGLKIGIDTCFEDSGLQRGLILTAIMPEPHLVERYVLSAPSEVMDSVARKLHGCQPSCTLQTVNETESEAVLLMVGLDLGAACLNECFGGSAGSVKVGTPLHRETVTGISEPKLVKSPNKCSRCCFTASWLPKNLIADVEAGRFKCEELNLEFAQLLTTNYGLDLDKYEQLWAFCPSNCGGSGPCGPNALIVKLDADLYSQINLEEKAQIIKAFDRVCSDGPLSGEPLCGVRFDLVDIQVYRGFNACRRGNPIQIHVASVRSMMASFLDAQCCLLEPMRVVDVPALLEQVDFIKEALSGRRGCIASSLSMDGHRQRLYCRMPEVEVQGFLADLKEQVDNSAFFETHSSHWRVLQGNVYGNDLLASTVTNIRQLKQLARLVPTADDSM